MLAKTPNESVCILLTMRAITFFILFYSLVLKAINQSINQFI